MTDRLTAHSKTQYGGAGRMRSRQFKTMAFHGSKGGVGATTLAVEISALLAGAGRSVVAVDLDLYRGSLHYHFDVPVLRDTYTLVDLIPVIDDIDSRILENALSVSPTGARLLPSPVTPPEAGQIEPGHVTKLMKALAQDYEHVLVDTPPSLDNGVLSALKLADLIILVVTPELASLGGAKRVIDTLDAQGVERTRVILIVNRSISEADLYTVSDIETFLDMTVMLVLPEDAARCRRLSGEGLFITSEKSILAQGIQAISNRLFRP